MLEVSADPRQVNVEYCQICTYPYEFCVFSSKPSECRKNLKKTNEKLYREIYKEDVGSVENMVCEKKKEDKSPEKTQEKGKSSNKTTGQVTVKLAKRSLNKSVTIISGLERFKVDFKTLSKKFSNKLGTGCSVVKSNSSDTNDIMVQGDFRKEVINVLISENVYGISIDDIKLDIKK